MNLRKGWDRAPDLCLPIGLTVVAAGVFGLVYLWRKVQAQPLSQTAATVLVIAAGVLGVVGIRILFDAAYDRWRAWQHDDIGVQSTRMRAGIARLMPDRYGRQGITYDGQVYRDLDTLGVYSQALDHSIKPVLEELKWQHAKLQAIAQATVPEHVHVENITGDTMLPDGETPAALGSGVDLRKITLSELQGRYGRGSYHRLLLGETVDDHGGYAPMFGDMTDMIHVLTSGGTGWGKSTLLEAMAKQLVLSGDCDLAFVDLGVNSFGMLAGYGLYPIAETPGMVVALFRALCQEMDSRRDKMSEYPAAKTLDQYNQAAGDTLRPLVVLVDEASVLFDRSGDACDLATDLTRMGRKYGVGCVLGGTDFRAETLPTSARGNCGARIAFHFDEPGLSRSIIRSTEAVNLRHKGRALALLPGRALTEFQAPIVDTWDDLPPQQDQIELAHVDPDPAPHLEQGDRPGTVTPAQVDRVLALKAEGKSDTAIARELWHGTSHYIDQVRAILRQQQHGNAQDAGIAVDVLSSVVVVAEDSDNE